SFTAPPPTGFYSLSLHDALPISFADAVSLILQDAQLRHATPSNTTLGVVATTAPLTREGAMKMAQMAHDGMARAIRPVHTMVDEIGRATSELQSRENLVCRLLPE